MFYDCLIFIVLCDRGWQGEVLKLMKNDHFEVFLSVWFFSQSFWVGSGVFYIRIAWSDKSATCSCLPKCFSFLLWSRSTCRIADTYKKLSFLSVFCRYVRFLRILAGPGVNHTAFDKNQESVFHNFVCQILLVFFWDRRHKLWGLKSAQT